MGTEDRKAAVRKAVEEIWNKGNESYAEKMTASSYVAKEPVHETLQGPIEGADGYKDVVSAFKAAFPDVKAKIEAQVAEGDEVVTRIAMSGTHEGEFMGIPATNKKVTVEGVSHVTFEGDEVVKEWVLYDSFSLLQQLGVKAGG